MSYTWNGPIYQSNSTYPYWSTSSATTYTVTYDGPPAQVTLNPIPEPEPRTAIEQLLADVESICALAR